MGTSATTASDDRTQRDALADRVVGCLVGGALGDAAGAAREGAAENTSRSPATEREWFLTDDTQTTLATCEAIVERGMPDPAAIAASLLRWYRARRLTGLGAATLQALRDLDAGNHWALSGRKGDRAAGNGAAMRIAPLAFCLDPAQDESRRLIRDVCRITHRHDEAYVGALAVLSAIWSNVADETCGDLGTLASHLPDSVVRDRLSAYAALPSETPIAEAARRFGASGYVAESVPLALFAARQVDRLGFARMLDDVISVGGDTDTNASLAGQVAGSALGFRRLPSDLLANLPESELVLGIASQFAERVVKDAGPAPA